MVADTIHIKSSSSILPSIHLLGQDLSKLPSRTQLTTVVDMPVPTLILSSVGAFFLFRILYSILRLVFELSIIPGTNVSTLLDIAHIR